MCWALGSTGPRVRRTQQFGLSEISEPDGGGEWEEFLGGGKEAIEQPSSQVSGEGGGCQ